MIMVYIFSFETCMLEPGLKHLITAVLFTGSSDIVTVAHCVGNQHALRVWFLFASISRRTEWISQYIISWKRHEADGSCICTCTSVCSMDSAGAEDVSWIVLRLSMIALKISFFTTIHIYQVRETEIHVLAEMPYMCVPVSQACVPSVLSVWSRLRIIVF